ncbi:uncharacterized protein LOC142463956 [Ascaphus truei]|uniref:uncharacterized protein LOC142463956 n=1 Tax=Ascaphus truei TaxID=8439 RepID=UPI003F59DC7E
MGTRFAPSYANLFMGFWEERFVWQNLHLGAGLVYYGRFIDDMIFIWDGEEAELQEILKSFDENPLGLKFTFNIDATSIVFLDLLLTFDDNLDIITATHFKEVSVNNYVHASSNHHKQWLQNIPLGQFHRIRRNCSRDTDFVQQSGELSLKFKHKGYDKQLINESFKKVSSMDRSTMLQTSKNRQVTSRLGYNSPVIVDKTVTSSLRFITTYNQSHKAIQNIMSNHWGVLRCDPHLKGILPDRASIVYRKARSMKSIIAPTKLKSANNSEKTALNGLKGNHKCGRGRCITCRHLMVRSDFSSSNRDIIYQVRNYINCLSSFVVYCIQCGCGLRYIGRTTRSLCTRFLEHRRSVIKGLIINSISRHYKTIHNQDPKCMTIMGLEYISPCALGGDRYKILCRKETYWIHQLGTLTPGGLNECLDASTLV